MTASVRAEAEDDYLQDAVLKRTAESSNRRWRPLTAEPALKGSDRFHTSTYLPQDLRRRLREIAAAEDCNKVHDWIIEGIRNVVDRRAV